MTDTSSTNNPLFIHLVSDSGGSKVAHSLRAGLARFGGLTPNMTVRRHQVVKTDTRMDQAIQQIITEPGLVFYTFGTKAANHRFETSLQLPGVTLHDCMDSELRALQNFFGRAPVDHVGDHETEEEIARAEAAARFFRRHDDGKTVLSERADELLHADVIVLGISRAGKTPTSAVLANDEFMPLKAANFPLTVKVTDLGGAFHCEASSQAYYDAIIDLRRRSDHPYWIGLTSSADQIAAHRHARLRRPGPDGEGSSGNQNRSGHYDNVFAVEAELRFAKQFFGRNDIPTLSMAGISIDEAASIIKGRVEKHRQRTLDAI